MNQGPLNAGMAAARADATRQVGAAEAALGRRMQAAGKKLSSVGANMTRHVTLPAAAAAGASVKLAVDFEDSMNKIRNLVGANQKQIDDWSSQLLELGPKLGKSPQELADALYFVASSGIKASDAMDVVTISAKASALGLGETEQVADAVTSAMNAYAKSHLSAADATNVLAAAVKFGKGESDEIAKSIGRVIPVASKLKVPFNDVGASIASMTLQGLDAAEATTALRSIFLATLKPTADSDKALKSVGLTAEDLRQSLEDKGTLATLQMLSDKFKGNEEQIARVFPNVRALVGAFNLTGDSAKRNSKIFDEMSQKTRLVQVGFQRLQKTDAQKLRQSLAGLQVAGIKIGEQLLPVLVDVAESIGDLAGIFGGMPKFARDLLIGAIAVGPLIRAGGAFLTIAGAITRIAKGEAALSVLGMGSGAAAAGAGAGVAEGAVAGAASTSLLTRLRPMLGKVGKGAGILFAANMVLSTIDEVHRQADQHSDDFRKAISAFAGQQDTMTIGGFGKAFMGVGGGMPTSVAKDAKRLQDLLGNTDAYKRATAAQIDYMKQLGRQIGLTHEARKQLGNYLQTVKEFPIGGGPADWVHHMGTVLETAATSSGKVRREMLHMAQEALKSGQITLPQFNKLKTTIQGVSRGADSLTKDWHGAMSTLGSDARKAAQDSSHPLEAAIKGLRHQYGDLVTAGAHMSKSQRENWKDLASAAYNSGQITQKQLEKIDHAMSGSRQKWSQNMAKIARTTGENTKDVKDAVGDMSVKVSKDYDHMVTVSGGGLTWLTSKTSEAAQALGIKKEIQFHASPASRGAGGQGHRQQTGGVHMVPGYGSGDKVPVHIDGQLAAFTEPGELVAVVNREASKQLMRVNDTFPRHMQAGGMIDPNWDPGTERLNAVIAPEVGAWERRYRTDMTAGYDPGGGHVSPGHNVTGTATDMIPGPGGSWDILEAGLRAIVNKVPVIYYGPQWVPGTVGLENHGRGNHAHIEWGLHPIPGIGRSTQIPRLQLSPDIPMGGPGQGAMDRTHDYLQAWLNHQMSSFVGKDVGGLAGNLSLPEIGRVTKAHGGPPIMQYVAWNESGGDTHAVSSANAEGLWQFLPSTWAGLHVPGSPFDPNAAAEGAHKLYEQSGLSPWSPSEYAGAHGGWHQDLGRGYTLARGGMLDPAMMARGGLIGPFLRHYGKIHKRKRRHKSLGKLIDRIKGMGVPDRVVDRIKRLDHDAAIYSDLADRASALTGDNQVPAKVFGPGGMFDQAGWLTKELGALWPLRNEIIKAQGMLEHRSKKLDRQLDNAKKRQRELKHKIRQVHRRIEHLRKKDKLTPEDARTLDRLRHKGLSRSEQEHLNNLLKKQKQGHLTDHERTALRKLQRHKLTKDERSQLRRLSKKDTLSARERHELEHHTKTNEQRQLMLGALGKIIPALKGKAGNFKDTAGTWHDRLDEVQGIGSPTRVLQHLDSPVDVRFGGELLDTQLTLRDLAHPAGAGDANALDIAGLVEFAKLVRVGAFDTVPFMGGFSRGGVALTGEAGPELLHLPTGTRVHSAEDTAELLQPEINARIYADFYLDGKPIRGLVRGEIRKVQTANHGQLRADVVRG